jgi:hypothetical protein
MTPTQFLDSIRAWQPVAYLVARALVYGALTTLGAVAAWYGEDPSPDWLPRALAVAGTIAGPLALVNLSRPGRRRRDA